MRVVVVGGTGNISTGVVKSLLKFGHDVAVFSRGERPSRLPAGVRYLTGDRKVRAAFEATMQAENFEAAIDMICYNAEDAESDVRAFRGVKHFIQTSTAATIGPPYATMPYDENTPLQPAGDYGRNKAAADSIFMEAHRRGELPTTIFKPSFIWSMVWPIARHLGFDKHWISRLRRGLPLLIADSGNAIISHCHADEAGVAYGAALGRTRCIGQTYILASPHLMTWREMHEQMADALGSRSPLVSAPADFLIKVWPENTRILASSHGWNHVHLINKLMRDVPEFKATKPIGYQWEERIEWSLKNGRLEDGIDETEDRIIAAIDRLWTDPTIQPKPA